MSDAPSKSGQKPARNTPPSPAERREQRRAAALRENLKRRKDPARGRAPATGEPAPATPSSLTLDEPR